jgi:hypothetical protein
MRSPDTEHLERILREKDDRIAELEAQLAKTEDRLAIADELAAKARTLVDAANSIEGEWYASPRP